MYVKAPENDEATIAEYRLGREAYKDVVMHLVYELHECAVYASRQGII